MSWDRWESNLFLATIRNYELFYNDYDIFELTFTVIDLKSNLVL